MDTFIYSLFFSCVGIGFYMFGKKNNGYFQIFGFILMIFPYFVSSISMLVILGVAFIILPFLLNWVAPR